MKLAIDIIAQAIRTAREGMGAGALAEEIELILGNEGYKIVRKDETEQMLERVKQINK